MKVGSLVECIDNSCLFLNKKPALNKVYTIRRIRTIEEKRALGCASQHDGVLLEEITNAINNPLGIETGYQIWRFRELLLPISNIEETINQNTLEYENRNQI